MDVKNLKREINLFEIYLQTEKRYSEHTVSYYIYSLKQLKDFIFMSKDSSLSKKSVCQWIYFLYEKGLKPQSINKKLTVIRSFIRFLSIKKNDCLSAIKDIYKLKESSYRATYKNSPSIVYELRSNTWWKDQYVWDPATLEECSPNESGKTNDGKYSIYTTGDGDAGAFYTNYFIVLRDVTKTDNYEPLVIQFRISGDGNDPNFNFFKSFNDILEMMIKTVELRPTSRG
jgi:hypothetical protein